MRLPLAMIFAPATCSAEPPTAIERTLKDLREIAAVVRRPDRRLVWHRAHRYQIAAPDFCAIDAELTRRLVGKPLEHIAGLRTPGAAVSVGGHRVAEDAAHFDEHGRRLVN